MPLFDDRFLLALPKERKLSGRVRATKELIEHERLLLLEEGHCLRDQALTYCSLQQVDDRQHVRRVEPVDDRRDGRGRLRHHATAGDLPRRRRRAAATWARALRRSRAVPHRWPCLALDFAAQAPTSGARPSRQGGVVQGLRAAAARKNPASKRPLTTARSS